MRAAGIRPSAHTFNIAIAACGTEPGTRLQVCARARRLAFFKAFDIRFAGPASWLKHAMVSDIMEWSPPRVCSSSCESVSCVFLFAC